MYKIALTAFLLFAAPQCKAMVSGVDTMHACALAVKGMDGTPPSSIKDLTSATSCIGMVEGVVGTLVVLEISARGRHTTLADVACFPEGFTTNQAIRVSFKFMQDHPDQLNAPGSGLIYLALTQAFPCRA